MDSIPPNDLERRLAALGERMGVLTGELNALRGELQRLRAETRPAAATAPAAAAEAQGASATPGTAESPKASAEPPRAFTPLPPRASVGGVMSGGVEELVGRYGTILVAAVAILLGVGAFLQWAIARGLLGPEMRVILGAIGAVALAGLGLWLRSRGNRMFGHAVLAIALAVVHVVSWGAGPSLHLIPSRMALAIAAAASAALAWLALRDGEEFLFILGLGGAMLAPFVTSTGGGHPLELLTFGGVVLASAIFALRDTGWAIAPRLISPFALGYMTAAMGLRLGDHGLASAYWPTAFAMLLALYALVVGARGIRRELVKTLLFLVSVGLIMAGGNRDELRWTGILYALLATVTVHALRRRTRATQDGPEDTWIEVVGLPLLFLLVSLFIEDAWKSVDGPWISAMWIALTAAMLYVDPVASRALHLTVILTAALALVDSLLHGSAHRETAGYALVAATSIYACHRLPARALLMPIGLALLGATLGTLMLVDGRTAYAYTPFFNLEALIGLAVVASWLLFSWLVPPALASIEARASMLDRESTSKALLMFGPVVAFFWVRAEFAEAFSRDMATFLLITYYAGVGVGTIIFGRRRGIDALRQAGLVLALFAAAKAVIGASDLGSIGLRVGSYMVVGAFLLGVGYLYRAVELRGARSEAEEREARNEGEESK